MVAVTLASSASAAELVVGIAAPLSGPHSATGEALRAAAEITAQRLNAEAGPAGPALRIVMADDGCDPSAAPAAAAALGGQGAGLVVGHPCAAAAIAAAKAYAAAGITFVAAAPRHPDLTRKRAGPAIFRLAGRDDRQGLALGAFVASAYRGRRIAVVHDRTSYARAIADGTRAALVEAGLRPPPEHGIVAGDKDYTTTVAGLAAFGAEVVVFAGFPTEAQALIDQMGARGLTPSLVVSDALADPTWTPRPAAASQSLSATVPAAPLSRSAAAADLALAISAERGIAPTPPAIAAAVAAAAAIEAWVLAARDGASTEGAKFRERLMGEGIATRFGTVAFDDAGDARVPSYAVVRWSGDAWRYELDVPYADPRGAASARAAGGMVTPAPAGKSDLPRSAAGDAPRPISPTLSERAGRGSAEAASGPPPVPVRNPRRVAGRTATNPGR